MSIRGTEEMGAVRGFIYALPPSILLWVLIFWIIG